ncbi:hypothetical protein AI2851V1_5305 (plasmid) [Klebsiella pneumoniae]|nr:hypothetical protein AI2851V1_5305 [Klebsiella pneumoniae]CAF2574990.1 hypothetical protein AI2854V1_5304 [Klebsiella pneumoniae]CAH5587274.1 hypothetical protein AI2851V1_5305 [Klebsiella pneumoniae]CAH5615514.1 hypothetical protein AI2854V1_5304 [Klebsiella pneumoniae]
MKDQRDKQTGNLLATGNAKRQARFAEQQRAMGRKARKIWATDAEAEALRLYLEELRAAQDGENGPASA